MTEFLTAGELGPQHAGRLLLLSNDRFGQPHRFGIIETVSISNYVKIGSRALFNPEIEQIDVCAPGLPVIVMDAPTREEEPMNEPIPIDLVNELVMALHGNTRVGAGTPRQMWYEALAEVRARADGTHLLEWLREQQSAPGPPDEFGCYGYDLSIETVILLVNDLIEQKTNKGST